MYCGAFEPHKMTQCVEFLSLLRSLPEKNGCCAIIKAAEGAGYTCHGDCWHGIKLKAKHFGGHCDAHAPRCQPCETERAAKAMPKPTRPEGGDHNLVVYGTRVPIKKSK